MQGMRNWGMEVAGLQVDPKLPTGRVQVNIIDDEPHYDIIHPAAWDAIEVPAAIPDMRLLYHGSLALRDHISREACRRLRQSGPSVVFIDVNLRSPWWRREKVLEDMHEADWVKLNRPELDELLPGPGQVRSRAEAMLGLFGLQGVLVTDGSHGAELLTNTGEYASVRPAGNIEIVDTVGAGDAMASVMVLGILRGWRLGSCLERAQSFASAVVGQRGATIPDMNFYTNFISQWSKGE
jgi:fructokinase